MLSSESCKKFSLFTIEQIYLKQNNHNYSSKKYHKTVPHETTIKNQKLRGEKLAG